MKVEMRHPENHTEGNVIMFRPSERGARSRGDKTLRALFVSQPKGVRFNAPLAKLFSAHNVKYVKIGVIDEKVFFVKPSDTKDGAFKLAGSPSTMQITSAEMYDWASGIGLIDHRLTGEWDSANGYYRFDIVNTGSDEDEDENEDSEAN